MQTSSWFAIHTLTDWLKWTKLCLPTGLWLFAKIFSQGLFFANFVMFLEQCWRAKLSRFTQERSFWLTLFVFNLLMAKLTTGTVSYMNWSKFWNLNCLPNRLFENKTKCLFKWKQIHDFTVEHTAFNMQIENLPVK